MENLVRYLISSVTNTEDFEITMDESKPKATIIKVKANEDDMGKIIGRNGKTISSIRTILRSASAKSGKRYILRVNE
ncbi:MAG: KH domain-containing protein [Clostridiales bacterium]|nr:KH domain-containing protein [Clostridiales bacterium]